MPKKDSIRPHTLAELLSRTVEQHPKSPAILALGREHLTYSVLDGCVKEAVQHLNSVGIGRHQRVAIVSPDGPEMAVAFLAMASCTATAPLNPNYRIGEYASYLADLKVDVVVVRQNSGEAARKAAQNFDIPVLDLVASDSDPAGIFRLEGDTGLNAVSGGFGDAQDTGLLLHTSGTTSRPKQVPITQANLCATATNIRQTLGLTDQDRCLNVMPLFHIHGLMASLMASISAGGSVICTPGFYAPDFFGWMKRLRPTWYTAIPTMHQAILARAEGNREIISETPLRFVRSSSASLPPSVLIELEKTFDAPVVEAYGMTEATHQMTCNPLPPRPRKPGSVGIITELGPEVTIMDQAGNLLDEGHTGEVVIRGPSVTSGYLENPAANAEAFTDGWFRTGDEGYFDEDGYLFLTGRLRELINRGGEKIAPREIDEALLEHPEVEQALAFSVPDAKLGEAVAAAVVLKDGSGVDELTLRKFAGIRLAAFKVPDQIVFLDAIPRGPTGKLQRIGLAERLGITTAAQPIKEQIPYQAPTSPVEKQLAAIWSDLLRQGEIGIDDDFVDLDGDSILATQVIARVREYYKIDINLPDFFDASTIKDQAIVIEEKIIEQITGS